MVDTAALSHTLMRYYTVSSVCKARQSVTKSLFFIVLLYLMAPALAVLVKYEIFKSLIGALFDDLSAWVSNWSRIDPALLLVADVNKGNILQFNELTISGGIIALLMPELSGLPCVVSGLMAAGGLAAALSTADGLLLTISNALGHDPYFKMIDPNASTVSRVTVSKILLLIVALLAAYVAAQKPVRTPNGGGAHPLSRCCGTSFAGLQAQRPLGGRELHAVGERGTLVYTHGLRLAAPYPTLGQLSSTQKESLCVTMRSSC